MKTWGTMIFRDTLSQLTATLLMKIQILKFKLHSDYKKDRNNS